MSKKGIITTLLAMIMFAGNCFAANPKREMRSSWLTVVSNIDWPSTKGTSASAQASQKKELDAYLDKFEEWNMTSTCLHVRTMGDAIYPSEYAPWSSYISGTRGTDPGWDPLAYFVEEAHKRGLEAYVWLNPYRWTSGATWSTEKDKEWLNNGMIITGDNGTYKTFNPALPETRELIVNVIKEILNNYAIDGMLFDDYFYPGGGTTESSSAPDYSDYTSSGTSLSIGDWRRENVNKMVADCYNTIKELRPDVRFGIGPAGVSNKSASKYNLPSQSSYGSSASDWQYAQIYSDPLTWMYEGTVDFISPQLYWETTHSTNPYGPLTHWWSDVAEILNCHIYISQASYKVTNTGWGVDEIINQVKINRQYVKNNNCGSIYYNSSKLKSYCSNLASDVYSTKALTPEITWKSGKNYDKVANLAYSNGKLSWDATTNGNAIIRYTVYAVPMTTTIDNAQAADGDGIDAQYLQKVVYGTSYTLDSDKQTNYWYAVCVFDGYGKEHTVAVVNYPDGESEKVTLVSPVGGAVASWETTFSWSAVENGTYIVEISGDDTFSTIVCSEKNITTNSVTLDLGLLEDSKTYYWRVRAVQPSKLESVSDVATFVAPTRQTGPSAVLVSPENGAEIEENITFSWQNVAGDVDNYTLEVSASNNFSTLKYSKDIAYDEQAENVSHEMVASLLGKGTFYWRVLTKGAHINPGASEIRSLTVTKISVGEYEAGYEIKTDKDSYQAVGTLSVESVWMRSVLSDYNNIAFGSNGSFNRGMCAVGDYVYVSDRDENSSGSKTYLLVYNANTGELIKRLELGSEASVGYFPCNDVIKDSEGNVCVTNLTLNASSTPLKVFWVNVETGAVTQVASVSTSKTDRVDHAAVWGDVSTGNFKVYVGFKGTSNIGRWTFENGKQTKEEICTVKALPNSASSFGIAPRLTLIDDNSLFVDGGAIPVTRYNFSTGAMEGSFKDNTALTPTGPEANGSAFFALNGKKYFVYAYGDDETGTNNNSYTFNVVSTDDDMSFASMSLLWTLPKAGLGAVNSTTMQAPVDYVNVDNNTVRVFLYVPGCGLCAYDITDSSVSGVESVFGSAFSMKVKGHTVVMSEVAQSIEVYNVMGSRVAHATDVAELNLNLSAGVYVAVATVDGIKHTHKFIIR